MLFYYEATDFSHDDSNTCRADETWDAPADCTVRCGSDLMDRISFILAAMKEEPWLPAALRSLILGGFLELRQDYRFGNLTLEYARNAISDIAAACFVYNDLTMKSKTLRHVRVLDMELAGFSSTDAHVRLLSMNGESKFAS